MRVLVFVDRIRGLVWRVSSHVAFYLVCWVEKEVGSVFYSIFYFVLYYVAFLGFRSPVFAEY